MKDILFYSLIILFIVVFDIAIYLFIDYFKVRIIKFNPDGDKYWYIAFSEEELHRKLNGKFANVEMPERPILVRWYKYWFPDKYIDISSLQPAKPEGSISDN